MEKLKNVFLFTGEGKYLLNKELRLRKNKFSQKYWTSALFVLNQENNLNIPHLQEIIFSGWLFSSKKLVVIYWIPADTDPANKINSSKSKELENFFLTNLDKIPQDTILIFVSFKPDKRGKFFKTLSQYAQIKSFSKLKPAQIKQIIAEQIPNLSSQNIDFLANLIGNDEQKLENELHKLKNLSLNPNKINTQQLKQIVSDSSIFNIFNWLDRFINTPTQRQQLITQLNIEEDPLNIAGALLWSFKNIIIFYEAHQRWISTQQITSFLKAPPFVISKINNYNLSENEVTKIKYWFQKINEALQMLKQWDLPQENLSLLIKQTLLNEKAIHSPN